MGACYFALQLIGLLMISEPTEEEVKEMKKYVSILNAMTVCFLSFASRVASPTGETANDQVAGPTEAGAGHKTGLCEVEG